MTGSIDKESSISESGPVPDLHRRPGSIRNVVKLVERLQAPDDPKTGFCDYSDFRALGWDNQSVWFVHSYLEGSFRVQYFKEYIRDGVSCGSWV